MLRIKQKMSEFYFQNRVIRPPFYINNFFLLIPNLYFHDVGAAQRVVVWLIAPIVLLPELLESTPVV
jgi:hypothetical protein